MLKFRAVTDCQVRISDRARNTVLSPALDRVDGLNRFDRDLASLPGALAAVAGCPGKIDIRFEKLLGQQAHAEGGSRPRLCVGLGAEFFPDAVCRLPWWMRVATLIRCHRQTFECLAG